MKNGNEWRKKFRFGGPSFALTAAVIVAVILLNVAATALCSANLWYIDLSPESYYNIYIGDTEQKAGTMYTLMDGTVTLLDQIFESLDEREGIQKGDKPEKVEIIFCAEPDQLTGMETMRYVYYTALNLQKQYGDRVNVSYRDVWSNPSSVDMYRTTAYTNIYQTSVIIAYGPEFRVCSVREFYTYDTDTSTSVPAAYNGQKWFVKQILDVTGAQAPICCLTTNHGEPFADLKLEERDKWTEYSTFLDIIEGAGYDIQYLDLEKDAIPEDCRLIITFDPQTDFRSAYDDVNVKESETVKLDKFLDQSYSYMVFVDADTPELPNLEEYLEFWGIELMRGEGQDQSGNTVTGNYQVSDPAHGLSSGGKSFTAQYVSGTGLGTTILTDLISSSVMPDIYFDNAMPIQYAPNYETKYIEADDTAGTDAFVFGYYESNSVVRSIFDMFYAGTDDSRADWTLVKDGQALTDEDGTPIGGSDIFRLMTISYESRKVMEGQGYTSINQSSYVCAVGSTAFVTNAVLDTTAYGNTDALLATLRYIGKEVNPVGLQFLTLYDAAMDEELHTSADSATGIRSGIIVTTVFLAAIPAVAATATGVYVLVRRRLRH